MVLGELEQRLGLPAHLSPSSPPCLLAQGEEQVPVGDSAQAGGQRGRCRASSSIVPLREGVAVHSPGVGAASKSHCPLMRPQPSRSARCPSSGCVTRRPWGLLLSSRGPVLLVRRGSHYLPTLPGRLGEGKEEGPPPGSCHRGRRRSGSGWCPLDPRRRRGRGRRHARPRRRSVSVTAPPPARRGRGRSSRRERRLCLPPLGVRRAPVFRRFAPGALVA